MPTTQIIIQTSIQSASGLPKDQFENVWHFLDVTGAAPDVVAVTGFCKIADFWLTLDGESGEGATGIYLGSSVGDRISMTAYDFAAAKPRPELGTASFIYAPHDSQNLPEEIALCMSYYTDRNLPSKRGRLYLGPLNVFALGGGTGAPRPSTNLTDSIARGATRLMVNGPGAGSSLLDTSTLDTATANESTAWALYSPKLGTFAAIEHGWVDNEWDGQSRRRIAASTRILFPVV